MTTTTERIANAIKGIIEEDRRADRERIAELERDLAHARTAQHAAVTERDRLQDFVNSLNAKLDEAHKENARLVMERPYPPEAYRINHDLSHPQAEKLLVVRIDKGDADYIRDKHAVSITERQWVGWLEDAHTAPVVEEQGPWVVQDLDREFRLEWCGANGRWERNLSDIVAWETRDGAAGWVKSALEGCSTKKIRWVVITLAEARAIEAKRG